ncbi:MAG: 3-methyl-2-oxobutanoate hydroxymethyltransferase [Solirubrobacterales bacterium]|nr:3-methyl-2-oxobutanoate hydroxymethyltransferase [Solirubrobacterales bacterium]MBV9715366.1 3-methyl-2-oxobutanoate hydroxymethyltransferase [Solirubrobacterales bacterium]
MRRTSNGRAGPRTDGQVLVLLRIFGEFQPRFVKRYAHLRTEMIAAVGAFADDVRARHFPASEHCYSMPADRNVTAVEPSAVMRAQRPAGAAHWDFAEIPRFWLVRDYLAQYGRALADVRPTLTADYWGWARLSSELGC